MVEEIMRVEPQLFGTQVQHTTIARKAELWQRIVDRVNAVGQHPRNREDIRKRWNDLRGKVRSMISRHNIAVQKTGGGPPPTLPQFTAWEQEVVNILHPDGLAGVGGGMDSVPHTQATADPNPPGNTSTAPTQRAHASVPRTRQSAVCPPLQGTQADPTPQQQQGPGGSGSGHTVQGTEARGNRATGRAAVRRGGEDRSREPTLQEALTTIMGAYHHSQEMMATVLARFTEIQAQQEERYMGFSNELRAIATAMGTIVQALNRIETTLRDHVAPQRAPVTSQEQPTTSAGTSGQEAPTERRATRTPPPADEHPPRKRNLRSQRKTE
ncbi:hypothetical protein NDU88_008293 [Pleurodeles waltl]|uniref:Myb/SANT-like DNA-binding domain-containing protein n=1 Tax=Pleurodeles waltl TaxID=8319 RepID=A0AAV7N6N3_PLEWA|nr:hypothetical protein NDU88_008293 [Pleurodeles waltl]